MQANAMLDKSPYCSYVNTMKNDKIIEATINYYLDMYIPRDHPDVVEVIAEDTYRVRVKPNGLSKLRSEWGSKEATLGANCLSLSLNRPDLGYAHPDMYSNAFVEYLNGEGRKQSQSIKLRKAFETSGFVRIHEHNGAADDHIIAVATFPLEHTADFHCYGPHGKGWWHKPGNNGITNLDDSGEIIIAPHFCDLAGYTDFLGYYKLPKHGVTVVTRPSELTMKLMG